MTDSSDGMHRIEALERQNQADLRKLMDDYRRRTKELQAQGELQQAHIQHALKDLVRQIPGMIESGAPGHVKDLQPRADELLRMRAESMARILEELDHQRRDLQAGLKYHHAMEADILRQRAAIATREEQMRARAELAIRKADDIMQAVMSSGTVAEFGESDDLPHLMSIHHLMMQKYEHCVWEAVCFLALELKRCSAAIFLSAEKTCDDWTCASQQLLFSLELLQEAFDAVRPYLTDPSALDPWPVQLHQLAEELNARTPRCSESRLAEIRRMLNMINSQFSLLFTE